MKRTLFLFSILILLLMNLNGCRGVVKYKTRSNVKDQTTKKAEKVPDYIIYNVKHYRYNEGKLSVEIEFKKGVYYSDNSVLNIDNCDFVYYDENGEESAKGHADRAKLYMQKSYMEAWDNIKVESIKNGTILNTSYLEWDGNKDIFLTDKPITIMRKNGDTISGIGMEADIALNIVTIKKNVKGVIKPR